MRKKCFRTPEERLVLECQPWEWVAFSTAEQGIYTNAIVPYPNRFYQMIYSICGQIHSKRKQWRTQWAFDCSAVAALSCLRHVAKMTEKQPWNFYFFQWVDLCVKLQFIWNSPIQFAKSTCHCISMPCSMKIKWRKWIPWCLRNLWSTFCKKNQKQMNLLRSLTKLLNCLAFEWKSINWLNCCATSDGFTFALALLLSVCKLYCKSLAMEIRVKHGPIAIIKTHMINSSIFRVNTNSTPAAMQYPTGLRMSNGNLKLKIFGINLKLERLHFVTFKLSLPHR